MTLLVMNLCLPRLSGPRQPREFFFYLGPAMDGYEVNLSKEVVLPYCRDVYLCCYYFFWRWGAAVRMTEKSLQWGWVKAAEVQVASWGTDIDMPQTSVPDLACPHLACGGGLSPHSILSHLSLQMLPENGPSLSIVYPPQLCLALFKLWLKNPIQGYIRIPTAPTHSRDLVNQDQSCDSPGCDLNLPSAPALSPHWIFSLIVKDSPHRLDALPDCVLVTPHPSFSPKYQLPLWLFIMESDNPKYRQPERTSSHLRFHSC